MIKLPEPAVLGPQGTGTYFHSYTEAQLKQFAREVLEQAAQVCEALITDCGDSNITRYECAIEIRKMKEEI